MSKYQKIRLETFDNKTALITINRPKAYNALTQLVLQELEAAIAEVEKNSQIGAFVITGEGEKSFVSGADIHELDGLSPAKGADWMLYGQRVFGMIERSPKPSIAAVNGYALGGGCELAMACDIRFASKNAKFGQPEIRLGNMPGWGGTQRLPRLIGISRAKQMVLTGEFIDADLACAWGLCNQVFDTKDILVAEALRLCGVMAEKGNIALAWAKRAINLSAEMSLDAGLALEALGVGVCLSTEDQTEGVQAFLEKRPPRFEGK